MAKAKESAHGKLSPVDKQWDSTRFMILFCATLAVAFTVIYVISSVKSGDYSWNPLAHDMVQHTIETSAM